MNFWWVNHKQTHKEEIEGGYLWSPKQNKNGSKNQTYINLTRARINDIVFLYASGQIKAVGIVEQACMDNDRPKAFGTTGQQWNKNGWLVKIRWTLLDNPFRPKQYISQIAPLLPDKHSPIQANGNGNQSCYLASISPELGNLLLSISKNQNEDIGDAIDEANNTVLDDIEEQNIKHQDIPVTEQEQLIKARRGQGLFKMNVNKIESKCRLTGVSDMRLLIASHIKPWRDSSNSEKLDGNNGLLLSPHVDKLFDKGWISFTDSGDILCASQKIKDVMQMWGLDPGKNVGRFNDGQKRYLEYHRNSVFKTNSN